MRKTSAALGSAIFFLVAPATVAGFIPWWITRWHMAGRATHGVALRSIGTVLILGGATVLVHAFARFVVEGLGTPAPIAPTVRLVVGGLYRHVRNPMYVAVLLVILGQAILLGQSSLVVYAAVLGRASGILWNQRHRWAGKRNASESIEIFIVLVRLDALDVDVILQRVEHLDRDRMHHREPYRGSSFVRTATGWYAGSARLDHPWDSAPGANRGLWLSKRPSHLCFTTLAGHRTRIPPHARRARRRPSAYAWSEWVFVIEHTTAPRDSEQPQRQALVLYSSRQVLAGVASSARQQKYESPQSTPVPIAKPQPSGPAPTERWAMSADVSIDD